MTSRRNVLKGSLLASLAALLPTRALGQVATASKVRACKKSAIPVGGGKIVQTTRGPLLITQPKKGTFRAFSATCTHQGCTIGPFDHSMNAVQGGRVSCPCHGAQFSPTDGSVLGGPARSSLQKFTATTDTTYVYIS
jgi:nitrite reductase/ring-hydroxylating ferredoxin subunit